MGPLNPGVEQDAEHLLVIDLPAAGDGEIVLAAQTQMVLDADRLDVRREIRQIRVGMNPFCNRRRCPHPSRS